MHDDILKSINFELQKTSSDQNSASALELAQLKKSINTVKPIPNAKTDSDPIQHVPNFSVKHYDHHQTGFMQPDCIKIFFTAR